MAVVEAIHHSNSSTMGYHMLGWNIKIRGGLPPNHDFAAPRKNFHQKLEVVMNHMTPTDASIRLLPQGNSSERGKSGQ